MHNSSKKKRGGEAHQLQRFLPHSNENRRGQFFFFHRKSNDFTSAVYTVWNRAGCTQILPLEIKTCVWSNPSAVFSRKKKKTKQKNTVQEDNFTHTPSTVTPGYFVTLF